MTSARVSISSALTAVVLSCSINIASADTVTTGALVINFDRDVLASLNLHDPQVGPAGLYLEEFFDQAAAASRTRTQTLSDNPVPGSSEIPATNLSFGVNGTSVTNLAGRRSQASNFSFDPDHLTTSATGHIGLGGVMRFRGDFRGVFVIGDLSLEFDPARLALGGSGWTLTNHYDFTSQSFDTINVTAVSGPNTLSLSGKLIFDPDTALTFFPPDKGRVLGTFTFNAPAAVPTPSACALFASALLGLGGLRKRRERA